MAIEQDGLEQALVDAHERAAVRAKLEKARVEQKEQAWGSYGSTLADYEEYFEPSFEGSLQKFLLERKTEKGKVYYLDVMGTARDTICVDAQAAMTLVDFRSPEEQLKDYADKTFVIPGDLLTPEPWLAARSVITKFDDTQLPGYDLVTCRPVGGWNVIRKSRFVDTPETDLLEWHVVQNMINLTSPAGGKLALQMANEGDYSVWIDDLTHTRDILVKADNTRPNVLTITKGNTPHIILPKIRGVIRPTK